MLKLYNGDCLEIMHKVPDSSVDLVLCDLPYAVTDCAWDELIPLDQLWAHYKRVLKPHGIAVLFGQQPFMSQVVNSNLKEYSGIWYWKKNHATGHLNAKKKPLKCVEEIAVFVCNRKSHMKPTYNPQGVKMLDKPRTKVENEHNRSTVYQGVRPKVYTQTMTNYPRQLLEFDSPPVGKSRLHPTQKPVDLLEYLIKTYSNCGETVLDNCMGSGSTGIACLNTGRRFIGIEKDRRYYDISCERICEWLNTREAA